MGSEHLRSVHVGCLRIRFPASPLVRGRTLQRKRGGPLGRKLKDSRQHITHRTSALIRLRFSHFFANPLILQILTYFLLLLQIPESSNGRSSSRDQYRPSTPPPAPAVPTTPAVPFAETELGQTLVALLGTFQAAMTQQRQQLTLPTDLLTTFRGLRPPTYRGSETAMQTEEWVERIEELLVGMRCPAVAAVSLVVTLLEGYARDWWRASSRSTFLGRPLSSITWGEFAEAFLEHFIPDTDRAQLQERFLHLRQGSMTVPEYQREFIHLARFAGTLAQTDRDRAARFYRGLRDDLRQPLIMIAQTTLHNIATHAAALELDQMGVTQQQNRRDEAPPGRAERPAPRRVAQDRRQRQRYRAYHRARLPRPQPEQAPPPPPAPQQAPVLPRPAPQPAPIPRRETPFAGNCFLCHQPGHIRAFCPQAAGGPGLGAVQGARADRRARGQGGRRGRPGRREPRRDGRVAAPENYALDLQSGPGPDVVVGIYLQFPYYDA